jgi:hypothetical protein
MLLRFLVPIALSGDEYDPTDVELTENRCRVDLIPNGAQEMLHLHRELSFVVIQIVSEVCTATDSVARLSTSASHIHVYMFRYVVSGASNHECYWSIDQFPLVPLPPSTRHPLYNHLHRELGVHRYQATPVSPSRALLR